ncbi:hypothetical protein C8J57DRAFT_274090 [Mycena rebaudengoi]|nr:hypothetical protein C8J57DRAFT_274090 [Mycena rebaudengoi]
MVVCVVLMILSIPCLLESLRRHIASMNASAAIAASSRELQLLGSINRSLGAPPHRPRRPCRTPSQISAASPPAYMKEPGDQELVVSRGPDGKDVDSADDNTHADNINITPPARAYSHKPRLPTDSPLFWGDATTPDPRGDPPAYFEVVEHHRISINDYPPGIPQRGFCTSIFSSLPPPPPPPAPPSPSPTHLLLAHHRALGHEGSGTGGQQILDPVPPFPTPSCFPMPELRRTWALGVELQHCAEHDDDGVIRIRLQEPTDATT